MRYYCPKCQAPSDFICNRCLGCGECCDDTGDTFVHRSSRDGLRAYRLALRERDKAKEEVQR